MYWVYDVIFCSNQFNIFYQIEIIIHNVRITIENFFKYHFPVKFKYLQSHYTIQDKIIIFNNYPNLFDIF